MGQLVQLTTTGRLTNGDLQNALTYPDPGVRAVAARIIGVERMLAHRAALVGALAGETDVHVIYEQIVSLLALGTPEAIAAVEQALDRPIVSGVPYLEWLAGTSPYRMGELLPSLARRKELSSRLGATTLLAAAQHPDQRVLALRAASSMRIFPTIWPGFMDSLFQATDCRALDEVQFGAARVTFGTDGRPTVFAIDAGALTPECTTALRSLRHVTLADSSEIPAEAVQWYLLPVSSEFVACSSAPSYAEVHRAGSERSGQTITTPTRTRDARLSYPADAKAKRVQGVVVIEAVISPTGCVSSAKVIRSVWPSLDFEAVKAVSGWHYTVPRLGDTPVALLITATVNFTLR